MEISIIKASLAYGKCHSETQYFVQLIYTFTLFEVKLYEGLGFGGFCMTSCNSPMLPCLWQKAEGQSAWTESKVQDAAPQQPPSNSSI